MSEHGRVCLFSPYLWPLFSSGRVPFAGGAETQQAAIARGLARLGFEVHVATCDFGQGPRVEVGGITFHATHPPFSGLPVLRFFHPRLTGNLRALAAADADLYYARTSGLPAGLVYDVARRRRAAFVFGAAHDLDADRALPLAGGVRGRWWCRRAIRGADAVIAQTAVQQRRFREQFGRESEVIPNLVEPPPGVADPGRGDAVVWLSTYKVAKRPEWMVELARRLPAHRFVMVGVVPPPPLTPAVFETARAAAREIPNLEVRGHLEHARLGDLFASAALFVHTSPVEGFPNTMLEAWAHGLPTVSVVDPDGIVTREGLGETAASLDELAAAVGGWMASPERRREAGRRARAWVEAHHAPGAVLERIAALFDRLIARRRARLAGR